MRNVLTQDTDQDRPSVVRATAIAVGLPFLVLETIEGLDSLESRDQAAGASPGTLVLAVRRPRSAMTSHAKPRLAVWRDAEIVARDSAKSSSHAVSDEGGIIRFSLGDSSEGTGRSECPGGLAEEGKAGTSHQRD
jgi:hypothetical protein